MDRATRPSVSDRRLVDTLDRALPSGAGGGADAIDADALRRALGLRSEYLAARVLAFFDADGDGRVPRDELLAGVRRLVSGGVRDRLAFAFRVHDHDGDGTLERQELLRMVAIALAEDDVTTRPEDADRLVDRLLAEADTNRDGRLSFAEFEAVVMRHPDVLDQMTRTEARWIATNEDLVARVDHRGPRAKSPTGLARVVANQPLRAGWLVAWALVNVAVVAATMLAHHRGGAPVAGWQAFLKKAGGAAETGIELNAALLFFCVMRRFLTRVRASWLGRLVPVDHAIGFHRLLGDTMFAYAIVHGASRLVTDYGRAGMAKFWPRFLSVEGLSGAALLTVFAVMWLFARSFVRRSRRFELFYFTHLLYVPWIVLAAVHAPAILAAGGVALAGFVVEQVLRWRRRSKETAVSSAEPLRSGVTRLVLARPPGFSQRAGDYLFLRIPAIARHEWHPFTISSAPEAEALTVHVRALGNWTSAVRRLVEERLAGDAQAPLVAHVDGAYGSPSGDIFDARFAVLVAAGIGVTPFASVLESIVARANGRSDRPSRLEKAHFYWLNRDQYSFEWFTALLAELERVDRAGVVVPHIYMTGGRGGMTAAGLEVTRALMHAAGDPDLVTGLHAKTQMGHPDWRVELRTIRDVHAPDPVAVFFCGPPGLGRAVRAACVELGMRYREERF